MRNEKDEGTSNDDAKVNDNGGSEYKSKKSHKSTDDDDNRYK